MANTLAVKSSPRLTSNYQATTEHRAWSLGKKSDDQIIIAVTKETPSGRTNNHADFKTQQQGDTKRRTGTMHQATTESPPIN